MSIPSSPQITPKASSSPVLRAVRAATRQIHEDLERRLVIAGPHVSADDYRLYLEALWGWLGPVEAVLWSSSWPASVRAGERGGKLGWIEQDLRALGLRDAAIRMLPRCPDVPRLDGAAERFGAAYVIEGSQLGGQVLLRRLAPSLAPYVPRYLAGYGAATGVLWKSFTAALEAEVPRAEEGRVAEAARATFAGLRGWLERRGAA